MYIRAIDPFLWSFRAVLSLKLAINVIKQRKQKPFKLNSHKIFASISLIDLQINISSAMARAKSNHIGCNYVTLPQSKQIHHIVLGLSTCNDVSKPSSRERVPRDAKLSFALSSHFRSLRSNPLIMPRHHCTAQINSSKRDSLAGNVQNVGNPVLPLLIYTIGSIRRYISILCVALVWSCCIFFLDFACS